MMTSEPILAVGILGGVPEVRGVLHGSFLSDSGASLTGRFTARATGESVTLSLPGGDLLAGGRDLRLLPVGEARAEILNVTIGIQFHWERTEAQTFQGALRFKAKPAGTLTLINDIALEQYLTSHRPALPQAAHARLCHGCLAGAAVGRLRRGAGARPYPHRV